MPAHPAAAWVMWVATLVLACFKFRFLRRPQQATIVASRLPQRHTSRLICPLSIYIYIYLPIYLRFSSGSRVKGVTGSRTRSTGRSPSTERVRITAKRTLDAAGTTRASRQRGMSRAKPAHIPPRRVGQDPTRDAETEEVSVAGTAKAAGRPTGREDRSPQGSRLAREARCEAREPGRCAAASRPNFTAAELDDAGQPHRHRTKAA